MPRGDNLRATMGHTMPDRPYFEANAAELAYDLFFVAMLIGLFAAAICWVIHSVQTTLAPAEPAPAPIPSLTVAAPDLTPPPPPPPAQPSSDFTIRL